MQPQDIAGRRILEIGCGLALASLLIHRRDGDITASDRHPPGAAFLNENLRLNGLGPPAYQTGHWECENRSLERFDLIIASDVLYERNQPATLAGFIDRHAERKVDFIIVDPDRDSRNPFCRHMAVLGYTNFVSRAATTQCGGERYKGNFLHFRREQAQPGRQQIATGIRPSRYSGHTRGTSAYGSVP